MKRDTIRYVFGNNKKSVSKKLFDIMVNKKRSTGKTIYTAVNELLVEAYVLPSGIQHKKD